MTTEKPVYIELSFADHELIDWAAATFKPYTYLGDLARQPKGSFTRDELFHIEIAHEGYMACYLSRE